MSPPGLAATTQTSGEMSAEAASQTQQRIDAALRLTMAWSIGWSRSKVLRLVRSYECRVERNGHTLFAFLVNAAKLTGERQRQARVVALNDPDNQILFKDPVGEEAVRNVLRQRGF